MKKLLLSITLMIGFITQVFAGGTGESIKIGVAGPHTGDLAAYGVPTLEATQIIAKEVNAAGGINETKIELVIADDACDPGQSTNVASKLVAAKVIAVIGHVCSGSSIAALPTYMSVGIPSISPSTNPILTKSGKYTGFFRTLAPDDEQAITQAKFLINKLQVSKVAIIHDQQDYGKGLADSTKDELKRYGKTILIDEGITAGAVDYSAVVSKIIAANVDAVVFGGYHPEGSKLIDQLKKKGFNKAFIAGETLKSDAFLELAGANAEGVYATGTKDYSNNPAYKAAEAQYEKEYNKKPGTFYYEGHAAMTIALDAIKAGNKTAADVKKYLESGAKFDTAIGNIYFDAKGDAVGTGFEVYQVKNGVYTNTN